ncbi:MAG: hypothetical protein GX575_15760 [Candidatus Anammoximicrobium sp.]|nr:hypothetical protein [Candidatus Anammoximicrobium sp.]
MPELERLLQEHLEKNIDLYKQKAIHAAAQTWGVRSKTTIRIRASTPRDSGGRQTVDYFQCTLQRLYEKGEDRFWEAVRPQAKLAYDMDDVRVASHRVYSAPSHPLTLAARPKSSRRI